MDLQSMEGMGNVDETLETSDISPVPEGVRGYVDLIGDEDIDGWRTGEPGARQND